MQILFILLSLFSTTLCAQAAFNAREVDAIAYDDSGNYIFFQKLRNGNYRALDLDFDVKYPIKDNFFKFLFIVNSPFYLFSEKQILYCFLIKIII